MTPLLCLVGPTAVGKTSLAVELARSWNAEIVGADASQVYCGLDIGTGKASSAALSGVRHHVIDMVEPDVPVDVATYVRWADAAIIDARSRGARVIVCGGTGMYIRALIFGLCSAPPVEPAIRAELHSRIEAGEVEMLHAELAAVDAETAARVAPRDRQRIERALGVWRMTGRALSEWQAEHRFAAARYPAIHLGLRASRDVIRARIAERTAQMFAHGFAREVAALRARGYGPALRSLKALGYRHVAAALDGDVSMAEARERTIADTRRYAKRQMTWFGANADIRWFDVPVERAALEDWLAPHWRATAEEGDATL